jgi:hypothetical protein
VVTIDAWPFLVAPTPHAPPRLIVGPDWALGDERLRTAARHAPEHVLVTAAGSAVLRLARVGVVDFCLIYRVVQVRKSDYGIAGDEPAEDRSRREIEALEGLAVRCGEDEASELHIGTADFDVVRDVVSGPYRDYWQRPQSFRTRAAPSFLLTGAGGPVKLRTLNPWLAPGYKLLAEAPPARVLAPAGPEPASGTPQLTSPPHGHGDPWQAARRRKVIAAVAAAVVAAAGIGVAIARPWETPEKVQQPRHLAGTATSGTSIKLSWVTTGPQPDHYELSVDGRLITVPGNVHSYRLTRLAPRTAYRVWIEAFGKEAKSARSATIDITTPAAPVQPDAPRGG